MQRISSPRNALDYPRNLENRAKKYVIWANGEHAWPDARRSLSFLSADKTDIMKGYALMTQSPEEAKIFDTAQEAMTFLGEHTRKRGNPYQLEISTVEKMIRANFDLENLRRHNPIDIANDPIFVCSYMNKIGCLAVRSVQADGLFLADEAEQAAYLREACGAHEEGPMTFTPYHDPAIAEWMVYRAAQTGCLNEDGYPHGSDRPAEPESEGPSM